MNALDAFSLIRACLRSGPGDAGLRQSLQLLEDWPGLLRWADHWLVVTALYPALQRKDLLAELPKDVCDYLEGLSSLNRLRNARLLEQILRINRALRADGLQPIFLKGSAALLSGRYADAGERLIGDIDVLVGADGVARAHACLQLLGYTRHPQADQGEALDPQRHHAAPLWHRDHAAVVELHRRISLPQRGERLYRELPGPMTLELLHSQGACLVLTPTWALANLFVHSMLQDAGWLRAELKPRDLFEAERIIGSMQGRLDWQALRAAAKSSDCLREWSAFTFAVSACTRARLPRRVPDVLRGQLWWMRVYAQLRWPAFRRGLAYLFHHLQAALPRPLRGRLGWTDYGWFDD